jgi:hypothetical protein
MLNNSDANIDIKTKNKESIRERFVRIIERRVNVITSNLDSLGKCSNKRNYEYTDDDVKKIFNEIDKKCKEVKAMFNGKTKNKMFKLE